MAKDQIYLQQCELVTGGVTHTVTWIEKERAIPGQFLVFDKDPEQRQWKIEKVYPFELKYSDLLVRNELKP
jgi:hypothetical protein